MRPYIIIAYIIAMVVAVVYALIRAKHDSYVNNGPWKTWAFVEGVMVDLLVVFSFTRFCGLPWWHMIFVGLIFAFTFWLVFDCFSGWLRHRDILYIGDVGFDKKMRETFFYNKKFLWMENPRIIRLVLVKMFFLFILTAGYISIFQ